MNLTGTAVEATEAGINDLSQRVSCGA
jgi:hypothetical protein